MLDNYRNMLLISLKPQLLSNLLLVDFPFFPDCSKIRVNFFTASVSLSCKPPSPISGEADPTESWSADSFLWGFLDEVSPHQQQGEKQVMGFNLLISTNCSAASFLRADRLRFLSVLHWNQRKTPCAFKDQLSSCLTTSFLVPQQFLLLSTDPWFTLGQPGKDFGR